MKKRHNDKPKTWLLKIDEILVDGKIVKVTPQEKTKLAVDAVIKRVENTKVIPTPFIAFLEMKQPNGKVNREKLMVIARNKRYYFKTIICFAGVFDPRNNLPLLEDYVLQTIKAKVDIIKFDFGQIVGETSSVNLIEKLKHLEFKII